MYKLRGEVKLRYILFAFMIAVLPLGDAQAKAFSDVDDDNDIAPVHDNLIYDPLEFINRPIYRFNTLLDKVLMKPIAKGYRHAVPLWGRQRIHSFLGNLSTPVDFFNAVLQGDVDQSFHSFWRFFVNTTFGIGGLFDIASLNGLNKRNEDFGQTLGVYGIGSGPYLVLPLLGPSSLRDATGRIADSVMDPFNYVNQRLVLTRHMVGAVDAREGLLEVIDQVEKSAIDPYAAMRSMYLQNQDDKIRNGATLPSYNIKFDWDW